MRVRGVVYMRRAVQIHVFTFFYLYVRYCIYGSKSILTGSRIRYHLQHAYRCGSELTQSGATYWQLVATTPDTRQRVLVHHLSYRQQRR